MNTLAELTREYPRLAKEVAERSGLELLWLIHKLKVWRSRHFAFFDGRFSTIEKLIIAEMEARTGYSEEYFK